MLEADTSAVRERPHRRFNALTGEWVFVSPHRNQRPWQGSTLASAPRERPTHDPGCYLCPGNRRAGGQVNPQYLSTFVFENDFPALLPALAQPERLSEPPSELLVSQANSGECRVLCYSPRHDLDLAQMDVAALGTVVNTWTLQSIDLAARWDWVQIFENRGELMGCSNPHPHGQIWASDFIPSIVVRERLQQENWFKAKGAPLLVDYAAVEAREQERVIIQDEHWIALLPWWAAWPFELMLLPKRHVRRFSELEPAELCVLAPLLKKLLQGYDRLFECPFPYSFGWHGAPSTRAAACGDSDAWQLHAHFYPPLLRSSSVRKFMVGYELLGETQRDLTPEAAAERLRACVPA